MKSSNLEFWFMKNFLSSEKMAQKK
jgi:hypothetical protein